MTLPLWALLLLLASITGVQPPIVDASARVVVSDTMGYTGGYNCGGAKALGSRLCPSDGSGDISISSDLWVNPLLMQHVLMHEYGHTLYGGSESEAEAYACRQVPMAVTVSGVTCNP